MKTRLLHHRLPLAALSLGLILALPAHAVTMAAYHATIGIAAANSGSSGVISTFEMGQFDPILGTLESVDVTITGDAQSYSGQNTFAVNNASAVAALSVGINGLSVGGLTRSEYFSAPVTTLAGMFSSGQATQINNPAFWGGNMLSPYVGTSTVSGNIVMSEAVGYNSGPSYFWVNNGQSFGATSYSVDIAYNYVPAPVPEADSYALLALGMGLTGWLARRKQQSA